MTPNVRRFVEVIAKSPVIKDPIIEIGSYLVPGQRSLANLRDLFSTHRYIGCDVRRGPGVDRVENAENLSFKNKTIGTVLMLETIEHVENYIRAIEEIHRVLKSDGLVILSSLMNFQIHAYPRDYWRFTPLGFEFLLRRFPVRVIGFQGEDKNHPTNIFGIGFKKRNLSSAEQLLRLLKENSSYIKGGKPWRHRFLTFIAYLKKGFREINHYEHLKFNLLKNREQFPLDKTTSYAIK